MTFEYICGALGKIKIPILIIFTVMFFVSFALFAIDKKRAVRDKWRIRESTLIAVSILFGALGSLVAMYSLRHKTKKPLFVILIPVLAALQLFTVVISIIN